MKSAHIIPIGTSILRIAKPNVPLHKQFSTLSDAICANPELSAELSALAACGNVPDQVTLLYTNTPEGIVCRNVLERYFRTKQIKVAPAIKVEDIHDTSEQVTQRLCVVRDKLYRCINSYVTRGFSVVAHITGGFKSVSAMLYSVASGLGVPTYYKHELFKTSILLPGVAVSKFVEPKSPLVEAMSVGRFDGIVSFSSVERVYEKDFIKAQVGDGVKVFKVFFWRVKDNPFATTLSNLGDGTYKISADILLNPFAFKLKSIEGAASPLLGCDNPNWDYILYIIDTLSPVYKSILKTLFTKACTAKFIKAPAAIKMHHNTVGGLVEHTANMLRMGVSVCQTYAGVDRDLLLAAIICHDIGKIDEYKLIGFAPAVIESGLLFGHIACGFGRLVQVQKSSERDKLLHCILSHHGSLEHGSPVLPKILEAKLLHQLDMLDATEGKHRVDVLNAI